MLIMYHGHSCCISELQADVKFHTSLCQKNIRCMFTHCYVSAQFIQCVMCYCRITQWSNAGIQAGMLRTINRLCYEK